MCIRDSHYDDVIETILMGMLYGAQIQTMMPKLHSTNFEGMELILSLIHIWRLSLIRQEHIYRAIKKEHEKYNYPILLLCEIGGIARLSLIHILTPNTIIMKIPAMELLTCV